MSQYTILRRQDLRGILDDYTDASVTSYRVLKGGQENTNYLVETSAGTFVLTVSESKSIESALKLARLLGHLNSSGIHTSIVKPTLNGALVHVWQGKPIILKEYLHGEVVQNLSGDLLELIGQEMGQLHQVDSPDYISNVLNYDLGMLLTADEYESDESLLSWFRDMHRYISDYLSDTLPKSLIHSDVFWNNVIVNLEGVDGRQGVTIMDFEEACYYYRIFDVGMAIVGLCSFKGKIDLSKARSFLTGYQKEVSLDVEEQRALKPFVVIAAAAIACWRHKQFDYSHPELNKKSSYKIMKELADHTRALPLDGFTELL